MKNKEELKFLIDAVKTSQTYEGNYGYRIAGRASTLSKVDELDRELAPDDYLEFLEEFGYGELDAAFYLDDGPEKYSTICGREIEGYEGFYVFGGNASDVLYAFDTLNNWQVVEISSELEEFDILASNFSDFILDRLIYINLLIKKRATS